MSKVIAVDFDGILFDDEYPEIGAPNIINLTLLAEEQCHGAKIILWTCRKGKQLRQAVRACAVYGIHFDAVNRNLPEHIRKYHGDTRKIFADEYWDDRAKTPADLRERYYRVCSCPANCVARQSDYCRKCIEDGMNR